jgi:hypothetical protein
MAMVPATAGTAALAWRGQLSVTILALAVVLAFVALLVLIAVFAIHDGAFPRVESPRLRIDWQFKERERQKGKDGR